MKSLPAHPNGLRLSVFDAQGDILWTKEYYSYVEARSTDPKTHATDRQCTHFRVGGGFVVTEGDMAGHPTEL